MPSTGPASASRWSSVCTVAPLAAVDAWRAAKSTRLQSLATVEQESYIL